MTLLRSYSCWSPEEYISIPLAWLPMFPTLYILTLLKTLFQRCIRSHIRRTLSSKSSNLGSNSLITSFCPASIFSHSILSKILTAQTFLFIVSPSAQFSPLLVFSYVFLGIWRRPLGGHLCLPLVISFMLPLLTTPPFWPLGQSSDIMWGSLKRLCMNPRKLLTQLNRQFTINFHLATSTSVLVPSRCFCL